MSGFRFLICVGLAQAVKIGMKVEEGNEEDELHEMIKPGTQDFLNAITLSGEAKHEFYQHNTAFTAMKAYQMTGAASFSQPAKSSSKASKNIWVQAVGRSGANTVYDLILQAVENEKLFSIFEPCEEKEETQKCIDFMTELQRCHFDEIDHIVHWQRNSARTETKSYGKLTATHECDKAGLRVFKTENSHNMHRASKAKLAQWGKGALGGKVHDAYVVHVVRDPRAIWASQKLATQKGVFQGEWEPEDICKALEYNSDTSAHHKVVTIKFEDLVNKPKSVAMKLYAALELKYTDKQLKWVAEQFGKNSDCLETSLSTCKRDSVKSLDKWKQVVDKETARKFTSTSCRNVFSKYGYQLDNEASVGLKVKRQRLEDHDAIKNMKGPKLPELYQ
eukprot:gnl/MRDRNA2_/MRDRNA2_28532_c0_seq1.p1 gnl/MRDRNA2_/MRDRNA2_28532_c0~~gnl/MRDRNA2_/MRDRNA2_28532_c0_seq1.p1  ORF type:complete len:427 (+),score=87.21 gnl/MRDRNA2_/MRDRNA2_28532_c0_seq1:110-1282(+)